MLVYELFEDSDNVKTLASVIKANCLDNFNYMVKNKNLRMFRSHAIIGEEEEDGEFGYFVVRGRTTARKSMTSSQIPLAMISKHPAWEKFPSRRFSAFAHSRYDGASGFDGAAYMVIPFDSVEKFATIRDDFNFKRFKGRSLMGWSDIIYSLKHQASQINVDISSSKEARDAIRPLVAAIDKFKDDGNQTLSDIQIFSDNLQKLYNALSLHNDAFEGDWAADAFYHNYPTNTNIYKLFSEHLTPEALDASLHQSFGDLESIFRSEPTEVWFEGDYLLIRNRIEYDWEYNLDEFIDDINNQIRGRVKKPTS